MLSNKKNYKRITVMLDNKNRAELRKLQARKIRRTKMNYSFSHIINLVLEEGLKHEKLIIRKIEVDKK